MAQRKKTISRSSGKRVPSRRKAPARRAQVENIGMMDQMLTTAERSGGALARGFQERPLMMLAGAGLIGLIAAMAFSSSK